MLELVSRIRGDLRDDALAGKNGFGHLSHQNAQREFRNGKEDRTVQSGGQFTREFFIGYDAWRDSIDRAVNRRRDQRVAEDSGDVVNMNPWKPLPPAAQTPAQSQFEWGQHFFEGAS